MSELEKAPVLSTEKPVTRWGQKEDHTRLMRHIQDTEVFVPKTMRNTQVFKLRLHGNLIYHKHGI